MLGASHFSASDPSIWLGPSYGTTASTRKCMHAYASLSVCARTRNRACICVWSQRYLPTRPRCTGLRPPTRARTRSRTQRFSLPYPPTRLNCLLGVAVHAVLPGAARGHWDECGGGAQLHIPARFLHSGESLLRGRAHPLSPSKHTHTHTHQAREAFLTHSLTLTSGWVSTLSALKHAHARTHTLTHTHGRTDRETF